MFTEGLKQEVRSPRVDLYETAHQYILRLSLPGVRKDNLQVLFGERGQLEIKGKVIAEIPELPHKVLSQEIFQGPFHRTIPLPKAADRQKLSFDYQNGILKIEIGKLNRERVTRDGYRGQ